MVRERLRTAIQTEFGLTTGMPFEHDGALCFTYGTTRVAVDVFPVGTVPPGTE